MGQPPAPVRVGLGRSNAVVTVALLLFLGGLVVAGGIGAVTASSSSARVIGGVVAAAFAVPLLMLLRALPRFLAPRHVVFDVYGLHLEHGRRRVSVPWREVMAVGIGRQLAPGESAARTVRDGVTDLVMNRGDVGELAKGRVQGALSAGAAEALQVSGKRRLALEIYPFRWDAVHRYPDLGPYWKQSPPPNAGLPAAHWRFPLPPVVSIGQAVGHGAQTFQPQRWLGWFDQPWDGS
jgi:hypothetical protein